MLENLLKWHMNYILKVDIFDCFAAWASVCTIIYTKRAANVCVCVGYLSSVRRAGLTCGVLNEAVISSILAARKQSHNPDVVKPRAAAQAVSTHALSQRDARSERMQHVASYFTKKNIFVVVENTAL